MRGGAPVLEVPAVSDRYRFESCAACQGAGRSGAVPCKACGGLGRVQVYQPSIICPICKGTGESDPRAGYLEACVICRGTGWARTLQLMRAD